MPSPIAHISVACLLYNALKNIKGLSRVWLLSGRLVLLSACVVFSLIPDMDFIRGVFADNAAGYHNHYSHSILTACAVAVFVSLVILVLRKPGFLHWFVVVFLCYVLHVIMDFFTWGRGVMLWWPLSPERYRSPFIAFYGVRWSEGFISIQHFWTVLNELAFIVLLLVVPLMIQRCKRKNATMSHDYGTTGEERGEF
jgi:membrane-bound metal-dependent hydrolase YbcI (DUF457 family)